MHTKDQVNKITDAIAGVARTESKGVAAIEAIKSDVFVAVTNWLQAEGLLRKFDLAGLMHRINASVDEAMAADLGGGLQLKSAGGEILSRNRATIVAALAKQWISTVEMARVNITKKQKRARSEAGVKRNY